MIKNFTTKNPFHYFHGGDVNGIEFRRCQFLKGFESRAKFQIKVSINEDEGKQGATYSNYINLSDFTHPNSLDENPLPLVAGRSFRSMDLPQVNSNVRIITVRVINPDNIDFDINLEFEFL